MLCLPKNWEPLAGVPRRPAPIAPHRLPLANGYPFSPNLLTRIARTMAPPATTTGTIITARRPATGAIIMPVAVSAVTITLGVVGIGATITQGVATAVI